MRPRTLILAVACLLLINALIWLGPWLRSRPALTNGDIEPPVLSPVRKPAAPASSPVIPVAEPVSAGEAWSEIDTPQPGQTVPRTFEAVGRCSPLPDGRRLVLAVQTGRVLSPKMPPVEVNGTNWLGICNEYGVSAGSAFTLCVYIVSEEGFKEIAAWHAQGKATGSYPPFRAVPGGALLAQCKLRVNGSDR